jgi:glycosyltransferase involved in cell wall biosynthesis
MYRAKDRLENYDGKVILTSHSPKRLSKEIAEDCTSKKDYTKHKEQYDNLIAIDEYSFKRADYIIFPCKESEEPYYHTWKDYKKIHETNKNKYIYIPTGISPVNTGNFSRKKIREKYGIPDNKFVVCYIGRHNKVKGYDQLKDIASKVLEDSNIEVHFLIAGKEAPLTGLKNKNWTEAGWIDNPNELIFAADAFILPNQETYFDLILLQAMSIGKPIILTNTGGNKYFKKFKESGLFFYAYGDTNGAANIIKKLSKSSKGDISKYGKANKTIFEENFTIEIFTKKYIEAIIKIGSSKK